MVHVPAVKTETNKYTTKVNATPDSVPNGMDLLGDFSSPEN